MIQFAKSKEIIVGIASSTDRERIKEYLQMEDLTHDIDVIVALEMKLVMESHARISFKAM